MTEKAMTFIGRRRARLERTRGEALLQLKLGEVMVDIGLNMMASCAEEEKVLRLMEDEVRAKGVAPLQAMSSVIAEREKSG